MTSRKRLVLGISGLVLIFVIIGIALYLSFKKPAPQVVKEQPKIVIDSNNIETAIKPGVNPVQIPANAVTGETSEQLEEITVRNLARIFVERYHTYSSENNYQNIRDVQAMVSEEFMKKIGAPLLKSNQPGPFVSLTTEVVGVKSVSVNRGLAVVDLQVRKNSFSDGKESASYGEYSVILTKSSGNWLVSGETVK